MSPLPHGKLTGKIIGAAIRVHRVLGPGFLESIYENALAVELGRRGIRHVRQVEVPVMYGGVEVGKHRIDLLVEDTIVVELKAIRDFEDVHFSVVRSYLKSLGLRHGLLMNFASTKLLVRRVATPEVFVEPSDIPS